MAKKTVAKASSKKELKLGSWVEVIKNGDEGGHPPKTRGVVSGITKEDSWSEKDGKPQFDNIMIVPAPNKNGDVGVAYYNYRQNVRVIEAPKYVVCWSNEDVDPFVYAWSLEEAKKLAARKRVNGRKVIEARVFKAV